MGSSQSPSKLTATVRMPLLWRGLIIAAWSPFALVGIAMFGDLDLGASVFGTILTAATTVICARACRESMTVTRSDVVVRGLVRTTRLPNDGRIVIVTERGAGGFGRQPVAYADGTRRAGADDLNFIGRRQRERLAAFVNQANALLGSPE